MKSALALRYGVLIVTSLWLGMIHSTAQTFVGTNAPGQGTNYSFTTGAAATNLSLIISNSSSVYSYLLLAKGRTPTDTDFDFISRLNGATNRINLEGPEFVVTNYGLRVLTPAASATHPFTVNMTTNRTDLRQPAYPVLKPHAFTTTGMVTNAPSAGAFHYFQVDVPTNLPGWRIVLSTTNANADLYVQCGALPTTGSYLKASIGQSIDTVVLDNTEATNSTYFIGVYLPAGAATNSVYTLTAEIGWLNTLTWDPGTADLGSQVYTNTSASGGDYYFKITTQNTADGAWRSALRVIGGEANLYLRLGAPAQTNSYNYSSTRIGSDGFVLAQAAQWSPGQDWYLTVHATPGAQWTLLTGEAYVEQLPPLAADASSGTNGIIGPEGMRFFKTTISTGTLAWRLSLNGGVNMLLVDNTRAPVLYGSAGGGYYDWSGSGQLLLVPNYVNVGNQYIVGVIGNPGESITLDSRQQPVTDLPFNTATNVTATNFGYVTFRVQVPVQQIAWQVNLAPASGDPNVAVRRDNVPNEYVNDAFSDLVGSVGDSVTMVPPGLSDGTFYITVYGTPPFTCSMTNGQPVITDVHYVFQITNDAPARAGWRFYRVVNTAEQLGTYGWDLELSNYPAGTEIALRRNAVPSRWNYRNCSANCSSSYAISYLDYSGTGGFLQRPGHQADIWYIGIYQPNAALGNFVLSGSELTATPLSFDGAGSSQSITNQIANKWQYFIFNVPTNAMGWDLRLTNVTSGFPQLTICRDRLPFDLGTHDYNGYGWYYPWSYTTWPSGYSWGAGYDWTSDYYNPDGSYTYGRILAMGMGNPLQPGTYYVGVLAGSGSTLMSYTILSRGINTNGMAIGLADLAFAGGTVGTNGLPAREAAYYRVQIPSDTPSWKMRLAVTNGEALLLVQKDYLPNVVGGSGTATSLGGGRKMQKAGDEHYLLLPDTTVQTNIPAGTYYIAVASEGMNPSGGTVGTNGCGFALTSFGVQPTNQIGNLTPVGPDISMSDTLLGGEVKHYQFTVSPGVLAMEVRLDNRTANPIMDLRSDGLLVQSSSGYGRDGGQYYQWQNQSIINIATPAAGTYTLSVQADYFNSGYSNAAYTVVVHPLTSTPATFDGGVVSVTGHTNAVWRYFTFDVPSNAFGWDLRLTNTVGNPQLVVCRDLVPQNLSTIYYLGYGWYYPWTYTTWPSSNQWAASYDWTGDYYDANGTNRYGHILAMGLNNPLEPGRYYAGVYSSTPTSPGLMSYTLVSRGIGTNMSIPVLDMPFIGSVSGTNIPPREAVYYRVQVPAGAASWKLRLVPTNSEALVQIQKDYLPNIVAGGYSPTQIAGGRKVQKAGNEQFTQLPRSSEATITNGTYYIAVVSEGMNPSGGYIGTNSSSYTLYSYGPATTNQLGTVDPSGLTDISYSDSLEGGDFKFYQFTVPPGTLSLEVHLDNRVANPYMTLRADMDLTSPGDSYSFSDGHGYTWTHDSLINLTSPTVTNYMLCVQARYFNSGYSNATYTIRLHALGLTPVAFDGGTNQVTGQTASTWKYFTITVPTNAFGWDLRLTNITSGDPRLVIRRETLPDALYTHADLGYGWYYPWTSTSWPTGYQWAADVDWTGYYYSNNGSNSYGTVFQCGMGNPLSPGNYVIGVINASGTAPMAYTIVSRGIGTNFSIPILDMPFLGSVSSNGLPARQAAYYKVTVPPNQTNWKLRLAPTTGDALMEIQKDYLPSVTPGGTSPAQVAGGRRLQKAGNEQFLQLPQAGQSVIPGGTYYILVASEGQNPYSSYIGSNSCDFTLTSYGSLVYSNLGTIGPVETARTNSLEAGEIKVYQFTLPPAAYALEVKLTDKIGNSYMRMLINSNAPSGNYGYGYDYGEYPSWYHDRIINIANPSGGFYSLNVQADPATDATYALRVRQLVPADLAFDSTLSTPSLTNVASGTLADLQRTYFRVTVPVSFNGQPVLGWKLTLDHSQGNPQLRVRKDYVPADQGYVGDSPYNYDQMAIVPPFLTSGTWYIEVQSQGTSQFTLTSSALLLERPAWNMPAIGGSVTTPGLPAGGPVFGDTGIDTNGVALPTPDLGIDLEQGRFHYYAITVPSNNVGVLRTRLDAISGDPNLYIRVGNAPTLSHYLYGDNGSAMYERSLTANIGSEYGNWVPLNGQDELQLTPGTWYLAVQAGGNSNVRYRLVCSVGVVANLTYDGVALVNQTLAAGDWRYYRVFVPTNSFTGWNVTFAQTLGDVVMYVRDITPPGQGANVTDYRHWQPDNKNFGPYPVVDPPGTTNLPCPPLRPGSYYYLGFRAVNDATFTVSSTTNTARIDYTNTIAFYGGGVTNVISANGALKYRIDVPADARRWIHTSTHSNTVYLYLEQGTIPKPPSEYHWTSGGAANSSFNQQLYDSYWPWRPGYMYFLLVTNTTAIPQNFVFNMNGRNAATDDYDGDGLPDAWEFTYWPSIYSYNGTQDPDGDGVSNMEEYLEGTNPTNSASFNPRLLVNASNGVVTRNPVGNATLTPPKVWYAPNTTVQLSATADPGYSFMGWSGDASGTANPYNLLMNGHKTVTAVFGITNNSGADYQFQLNLASSVGTPPDLQDIGVGNSYTTETVDTCARIVRQFPLHNGLHLQPTASVIPTNIYTIVMLFRLDQTNNYRRLIEFKAGTSDNGLYVYNGRLYFYPSALAAAPAIAAGQYVQVVLTRDGTTVVGYVNGVQQFSFADSSGYGVISANDLRFFKDDTTADDSNGAVARIRLYAAAMPAGQVALLDRVDCGCVPPQFVPPMSYSNGVMSLTLQVTPNVTYQIQASTNLVDWVTFTNVTSTLPLVTITDAQAGGYSRRFYRGVTDCGGGAVTAPTVTTLAASGLQIGNATLNASINPNGDTTSFYFQYGTTTAYGSFSLTNTLPAGVSAVSTNATIGGLSPGTTYHYQAVASNSAGTGTGSDLTFTTIAWPVITSVALQTGPQLSLQLSGTPNVAYTLETSTNLVNWTVRSNCVMNPSGLFGFVETGVTNPPSRFYRLRWP